MWEINKQFHETESGRFLEFLADKVVEIALVSHQSLWKSLPNWKASYQKRSGNNCEKIEKCKKIYIIMQPFI